MSRPGSDAARPTSAVRPPVRRDRGAAAVEMALVFPLIVFLVFAIIDFGRMFNTQITLTEAAREGARATALGLDAGPRVTSVTQGLSGVSSTVTPCAVNPAPGDDAVVVVGHSFEFITPLSSLTSLFGGGLNGPIAMSGRGVMPCLG